MTLTFSFDPNIAAAETPDGFELQLAMAKAPGLGPQLEVKLLLSVMALEFESSEDMAAATWAAAAWACADRLASSSLKQCVF